MDSSLSLSLSLSPKTQQRVTPPTINLAGLGCNEVARRRAKCLESAMLRYVNVTCDKTMALPRGHGTKRKVAHGAVVREELLGLTGDPFHLLVAVGDP